MPSSVADLFRLTYLTWLDSQESTRQAKYAMFRAYYEGDHDTQLTARIKAFLELSSNQDFSLNFCPIVVDALAEKLRVSGFQCEQGDDVLWDWWRKNRMDALQSVVHRAAVRDGDTYLLVEYDDRLGRPRMSYEPAYDGTSGVHVVYSDENRNQPLVAVKYWQQTTGTGAGSMRRANLYYPERIEKYLAADGAAAWTQFDDGSGEWPIPWVTAKGEPLGIPVFHFRNKDQGYSYGESELEDVVPPQNALNKGLIDLLGAADTTGFRVFTVTGDTVADGQTIAPGTFLWSPNPDARIGAIDGADLTSLLKFKDSLAVDIARITRTPLSYFQVTGQVMAEGTLKQQESGLVAKAHDRQVVFGNAWEDAMSMARRLANVYGPGGLDEEADISCLWTDPESRNEKEHLEALALKAQLGVPEETLWAEMGYDAAAIDRMQEERQAAQTSGITGLGQALIEQERRFNAGAA
jgi:hypothetical protein